MRTMKTKVLKSPALERAAIHALKKLNGRLMDALAKLDDAIALARNVVDESGQLGATVLGSALRTRNHIDGAIETICDAIDWLQPLRVDEPRVSLEELMDKTSSGQS